MTFFALVHYLFYCIMRIIENKRRLVLVMTMQNIEQLRIKLIQTADKYGLNSSQTLQCSQELDALLIKEMLSQINILKKEKKE
jgi:hypothetical protein